MRCEDIAPLLTLAEEGTLNSLAAWRLRRHLESCPACSAERAEFRRLDARLRAVDPAAGFAFPADSRPSVSPLRRRAFLVGASTATIALVGGVAIFAPGQNAFAQVQQAMSSVRTAEWTETETWFSADPEAGEIRTIAKTRVRARMNPPALLFETTGRNEGAIGSDRFTNISLKTPEDFRTYRAETRQVTLMPHEGRGMTRKSMEAVLRGEILGKLTFVPPDVAKNGEMQKALLDGKPALQFTFRSAPLLGQRERSVYTLWADAETKRVLRTVLEQRDAITNVLTFTKVTEGIRCNVSVPDKAFTLNAPAGTPVYHENYWWESKYSLTLTAKETARINRLIDETYAGVLASDWKRASAGWDLDYAASLPDSPLPPGGAARWLRLKVAQGSRYKVMRRIAIRGINDAPYARVLGFGDATVPPGQPHLVAVSVTPGILYRDGFQEIGVETFYFRRTANGGFRIVGWQYPEGQRQRWRQEWLEKRKIPRKV